MPSVNAIRKRNHNRVHVNMRICDVTPNRNGRDSCKKAVLSIPSKIMENYYLVLLGFLCLSQQTVSDGYYTVLAPKVLRPNSEYHVAVSTQMITQPTTVVVEVVGTQSGGDIFETSQTVTVEPYTTETLKLDIGDIGPGIYNFTARGIDGLKFLNTTQLNYVPKSFSVFIQTDKAMYKPGQKVLFRAIVVNAYMKPFVNDALDIYISDGKGNRVKQWTSAQTTKGVFSGELQLSDFPVFGEWSITVSVSEQNFNKIFEVAEYVLPKFEVTVDAPAHATFSDSQIVATVQAKYTYGKAVQGDAIITRSLASGALQLPNVRQTVPIDGKVAVELNIADLKLDNVGETTLQFDVVVEEALTGRSQNTSFEVQLHKYKYNMEVIKTSEYFKPGLKYTAFVKLAYYDGSPVQDQQNPVIVRYGFTYDQTLYTEEKHKLPNNGLIELNFYPPPDSNETVLGIEAEYLGLKQSFPSISSASSPSNTFIQAILVTQNPTVNQDIELDVSSTEPMKYFSYEVIGRGDVVEANTVKLDNTKTRRLKFLTTYTMVPTAHVVVYYMRDDGEVVADAIDIDLDGTLQNFVNININPTETNPGGNVEMTIEAKPNSYIGLLGIDQSVLLLKSGNDITKDIVTDELKSYDVNSGDESSSPMMGLGVRSLYWWPSSSTARQVFDNSGSIIFTNGWVYEKFEYPVYYLESAINFGGAIPNAGQSGGSPVTTSSVESVRIRRNFPETWLWKMLEAGDDGKKIIEETAPDTITSWIITGFSLDPQYGLGLIESPTKLTVFRPFFISLDLPYSVLRGEVVSIPIVVFNYMTKDVVADVTLENEELDNFEFIDINGQSKLELSRRTRVKVKANSGSSVSFMIIPKKLGQVAIKVTAISSLAGDAVVQNLLVKPEGETHYFNKAFFVDLRNTDKFQTTVTLEMPKNIVEGSDRVEVSAIGDVLGPSISNLDQLIRMPYGCGEQNMLYFVPNIVVVEYLKSTNQLTPEIEVKALQFMEIGYQRELTYRHSDGSFSAFGESDPSGSTWLTAFVAKSFRQAMPYITVDERVIQSGLSWLSTKQSPSGNFPEVGQVIHHDMQGDAGSGLALTAYTLIAFLEDKESSNLYSNTVNKALEYIVRNLDGVDDIYALALSSYALNVAQHPNKDIAFNMFESRAQISGDMKWWTKPIADGDENPWNSLPNSVDIEMTAYGLLTYLQRGLVQEALSIMKWLVTQRNEQGGFSSTQDTVIGLQALAKLSELLSSGATDITVSFSYQGGRASPIKVNKDNAMILQKQELPANIRKVDVTASGSGLALVQVSFQYNLDLTGEWPLFTLKPQVDKNSDINHLLLSICSGFIGSQGVMESNMAVMEVSLPSGFTVDADVITTLRVTQYVKRVETKNGDTVVILYFDKMTKEEYCITVSAFRTHKVAKQKPVPVIIYDYYDSSRRATVFYEPKASTLCDICEGEDCNTCSAETTISSQNK